MAKTVKFVASEGQGSITVDGHRFRPGQDVEVPDELADELLSGSARLEGYRFEAVGGTPHESPTDESTTDPST